VTDAGYQQLTKTARFARAASDPGLAQSGRAGVRAKEGRLVWFERREAPSVYGYARTYVQMKIARAVCTAAE
jgi:hypothetical protein